MTISFPDKFLGSTFQWHTTFHAFPELKILDSEESSCFSPRHYLSVYFYGPVAALVIGLFDASRPATVGRRVITTVVHAFNTVLAGRARSHISKEGGEVVTPFVADLNPTRAVAFVANIVW